jgi:hypothetical protein
MKDLQTTEPTYRKAAKAARAELAETLRGIGIDPKRAKFETEKIYVRCFCKQKREAAKASAMFLGQNGTSLMLGYKVACTCKAESK